MTAYLTFYAIAGLPAMMRLRERTGLTWAFAWIAFVLFIGLRHHVGGDWDGYIIITERIAESNLGEALVDQELLFSLLTWFSTRLGWGVYGANFFGAVVFCTGLFAYCARRPDRWLALATAVPFLVVVAAMSANRQGMAIGIVLFVMANWSKWGGVKRSLGIILAGLFHTSAIFLLVLAVLDLKVGKFKKIVLASLAFGVGIWLLVQSETAYYRYTTVYVEQPEGVESSGAILQLLLNLLPAAAMLMWRRSWSRHVADWPLLRNLCWMTVAIFVVTPFFSVAAGRMALYMFPVSITFASTLPLMLRGSVARNFYAVTVVVILGVVLAVWLSFANTAFTYLPYRNVLTVDSFDLELPVWVIW